MCQTKFGGAHRKLVRITKDDDFTTAKGLGKAINALKAPDAGHVTVWFAMPCTWGSIARTLNKSVDEEAFMNQSVKLWDQLVDLLANAIIVANEVRNLGGDIVFEWPTGNFFWNLEIMQGFVARFGRMSVPIDGCTLGHTGMKGGLRYKPWTLMTTSPFAYDVFKNSKCPGDRHAGKHERCDGGNAARSALYPHKMVEKVHQALNERIKPSKLPKGSKLSVAGGNSSGIVYSAERPGSMPETVPWSPREVMEIMRLSPDAITPACGSEDEDLTLQPRNIWWSPRAAKLASRLAGQLPSRLAPTPGLPRALV